MKKTLAIGAALLGCISVSQSVQASAYAVSVNSISNFGVAFSNPTIFSSFTFTGDTAAINVTSAGNGGVSDAAASCIGCSYSNSFSAHGMTPTSYAYGDTQILNDNVQGSAGAAKAIGEAYLTAPTVGFGYGQGINTMTAFFSLSSSTTVTFDFMSDPYLQAVLSSGGNWASADMAMTITINKTSINGSTQVFSWAPDGSAGGISGGAEIADPFSLNMGFAQLVNGAYLNDQINGHFRAITSSLSSGVYNLNVTMTNTAQVETVPVPAAAWLLGSGLVGLLGVARRQQQAT